MSISRSSDYIRYRNKRARQNNLGNSQKWPGPSAWVKQNDLAKGIFISSLTISESSKDGMRSSYSSVDGPENDAAHDQPQLSDDNAGDDFPILSAEQIYFLF